MRPTLLILAAGVGSRYGGFKQLEPVGPDGAAILDYTSFDALEAGFDRVVLVIRRESEEIMRQHLSAGLGRRAEFALAFQELEAVPDGLAVPPGRTKPWGTGQAVLAAAAALGERPFVVVNADDYYGREGLAALVRFLESPRPAGGPFEWAMVGFRVGATLPEAGSVSRGLCRQDEEGRLVAIEEIPTIWRDGDGARWREPGGEERTAPADALVSMNLWGFTSQVLPWLGERFEAFLRAGPGPKDEFYLPAAVGEAVTSGQATVRVLPTTDRWCGITSPEDRDRVAAFLRGLIDEGRYPERLWG